MIKKKYYQWAFLFVVFGLVAIIFYEPEIQQHVDDKFLNLLNETEATFTKSDVMNGLSRLGIDKNKMSKMANDVLKRVRHIGVNDCAEDVYTSVKYDRLEKSVLSKFKKLSKQRAKIICSNSVITDVLKKYSYMSNEQKKAILHMCSNNNRVDILIGRAGSGKTTTLKAVAEIYKRSGANVIGMSLSSLASENLGLHACIDSNSIAYWAYNKWESINNGDVMVVDEAGMVGTSDWNKILNASERIGTKLIIVGDHDQLKPVSAGDCLRFFINETPFCELKEIRRQKLKWMQNASIELSKLNVRSALEMYNNNGKVNIVNDKFAFAAKQYLRMEKTGEAIVLCFANAECEKINDIIRSHKKIAGRIGRDIVKIRDRTFSWNDRIMFLKNNKDIGIKNGQTATIESFQDNILSVVMNSKIIRINLDDYDEINHAYAITLHKAQGKTFDKTILVMSKKMDSKALYVALTRHREDTNICCNKTEFGSFENLAESMSRYDQKTTIADYEH